MQVHETTVAGPACSASGRPTPASGERERELSGRELSSLELLRGAREIVIRHGEQTYRLRHTRNDKLILTK